MDNKAFCTNIEFFRTLHAASTILQKKTNVSIIHFCNFFPFFSPVYAVSEGKHFTLYASL